MEAEAAASRSNPAVWMSFFPSQGAARASQGRAATINYSLVTPASRPAAAYTGPRGSQGLIMYTRTEEITAIKGDKRGASHVVNPQLEAKCIPEPPLFPHRYYSSC